MTETPIADKGSYETMMKTLMELKRYFEGDRSEITNNSEAHEMLINTISEVTPNHRFYRSVKSVTTSREIKAGEELTTKYSLYNPKNDSSYRPLDGRLTIKESGIEGLGVFAKEDIPEGEWLGLYHIHDHRFNESIIRTTLGGYINHSEKPNLKVNE